MSSSNYKNLENLIEDVEDFPHPGVIFKDVSPLLAQAFNDTIDALSDQISSAEWDNIDLIAGVDARGFLFAAPLAYKKKKGVVMIRKEGKLPPPKRKESYTLEYGQDCLEMKRGKGNILLVDDVLATGGTLKAAGSLCVQCGYQMKMYLTLVNLSFLNDFKLKNLPVRSLFTYE